MNISSAALVLCCASLDFFVLQTFSETILEEISRSISSTSTSELDSISRCLRMVSLVCRRRVNQSNVKATYTNPLVSQFIAGKKINLLFAGFGSDRIVRNYDLRLENTVLGGSILKNMVQI